jgi:hypothetical protein
VEGRMGHRTISAVLAASVVLVLTACAGTRAPGAGSIGGTPGAQGAWVPDRASVPAAVTASGLVLEDADGPRLCAGAIADTLPPQCTGPAIVGWDWSDVEGAATASGTTWGEYRMHGTWDGETFTLGRPPVQEAVLRATHDPNAPVPTRAPDPACDASEGRLPQLREAVPDIVSVLVDLTDDCVIVEVPYDDGTLQAAVDARFGTGAYEITSTFSPVDE